MRFGIGLFAIIVLGFAATPCALAQGAPARPLIVAPVDETALTTLAGNIRPEAAAAIDDGVVADDLPLDHLLLQLHRPAEREAAFARYIDGLTDPTSPNYRKWLTATEIGAKYGPARSDLDAVVRWLGAHGFTVNTIYPSGMVMDVSATAGQVAAAFHTALHHVRLDGVAHLATLTDPQIPVALAPLVVGPVSLDDFFPRPQGHGGPGFTVPNCNAAGNSKIPSTCRLVAPADLATIYNFNPIFNAGNSGQGQTIAVVEDSNIFSPNDWHGFRALFHLNAIGGGTLTQTHPAPPSGPNNCANPGTNGDVVEATLDVEYASAAAPGADIEVASCKNTATTGGVLRAIENLVHAEKTPSIISASYGDCEFDMGTTLNAAFFAIWQQAVAEGISVFVAAGDQGGAACDYKAKFAANGRAVNGFASPPFVVAVGGTDFSDVYHHTASQYWKNGNSMVDGSAKSYVPEIPWNNSCASELIAIFVTGSNVTYGMNGFCNSHDGRTNFLTDFAGSGGPSNCAKRDSDHQCVGYTKPSYQQGIPGNPNDGVRDLPDVALFSAGIPWGHAYLWCLSDPSQGGFPCDQTSPHNFFYGFGTSFAAPVMAGVQALINHHAGGRQGNPNPKIYLLAKRQFHGGGSGCNSSLGAKVNSKCTFRDITEGDSDVPCQENTGDCFFTDGRFGVLSLSESQYEPAYHAHAGWDFATGIGSLNVANLVHNWP